MRSSPPLLTLPRAVPAEHPDGDAPDHPDLERRRRAAMHPRGGLGRTPDGLTRRSERPSYAARAA